MSEKPKAATLAGEIGETQLLLAIDIGNTHIKFGLFEESFAK